LEATIKFSKAWVFGIILVVFSGCASAHKSTSRSDQETSSTNRPAEVSGPPELVGPLPPSENPEQVSSYGPNPVQVRPIVLVLGPGLAKGFAYSGVFQALNDSKIPIGAIIGTEMGGLIGALYANSRNINQFEWGLLRFKDEVFPKKEGFMSLIKNQSAEGKKFESQLSQVFRGQDVSQTKIPLRIGLQAQTQEAPFLANQGSLIATIRATMAQQSLFTPSGWPDQKTGAMTQSSSKTRPFFIREAKDLGIGPVIVVQVLSDEESAIAWDELKEADLVIRPDMSGIGELDFQKRTDAAFRGKSAILKKLPEIKQVVGLPFEDEKRSAQP
jgi:NTE family protein